MKVYSKSLFSLFFLFLMSAEIFANEPPAPPDDNDPLDLPLDDLVFLFSATSIFYAFFVL